MPALSTYLFILWALAGRKDGQGYGFPFDRTHLAFAKRLFALYRRLRIIDRIGLPGKRPDQKSFYKLYRRLKAISTDRALARAMAHLEERIVLFDQLRDAMRMAPKGASHGLNCDGTEVCLKSIQKRVQSFRRRLLLRLQSSPHQGYQKMLAQIDQYWEKLFADPIEVQTLTGKLLIQPQRTNNAMERFFRSLKRALRRKSGNGSLAPSLRAMLADTPLVLNLRNPLYLKILLNGSSNLAQRFAQIDRRTVQIQMQKVGSSTFSVVHCGGDVEFTDGEVEHGD